MKTFIVLSVLAIIAAAHGFTTRPVLPDGRIVGGEDADIADFKYQLSLQYRGMHFCGASIIGKRWAVTAAHCLEDMPASRLSFRAGSSKNNRGGYVVQIEEFFNHPNYNTRTNDYDVALVKTKTDFVGVNVEKIPIPFNGADVQPGKTAIVSGWGHLNEGDVETPIDLQYVTVTVVDQQQCNRALRAFGGVRGMMFCAADVGRDSCQGDSGGPIVVDDVLVGVVSWGIGCAHAKYPGVYTRLGNANVRAWISNVAKI